MIAIECRVFSAANLFNCLDQGRRASRTERLPLAILFRAVGAQNDFRLWAGAICPKLLEQRFERNAALTESQAKALPESAHSKI